MMLGTTNKTIHVYYLELRRVIISYFQETFDFFAEHPCPKLDA